MSGETEDEVSGWTVDTLHQLLIRILNEMDLRYQQRFDAQQMQLDTSPPVAQQIGQLATRVDGFGELMESKFVTYRTLIDSQAEKVALALDAAEKAIDKAEKATEKRFDSVNEFRGQLADQAQTFARREYVEQQLGVVGDRLRELAEARQQALDEARRIASTLLPREVFDAAMVSGSNEREQLRTRLAALESRMDLQAGQQQGSGAKTIDQRAFIATAVAVLGVLITIIVVAVNIATSR